MRALRSVLAEQHAEATRRTARVVADCGYPARLCAHGCARGQALMRGIEAFGEAIRSSQRWTRQSARSEQTKRELRQQQGFGGEI
jgi:hypothetical protein